MLMWTKNRPPHRLFTLAFAGLAICVFVWGLQYKLSLYIPSQASSHQVPIAKLLSPNERPKTHQELTNARPNLLAGVLRERAIAALFVLIVGVFSMPESVRRRRANRAKQIQRAILEAFFVRPPPTLA